jgi:predicted DNA-binding transcriptional regulator AlpA
MTEDAPKKGHQGTPRAATTAGSSGSHRLLRLKQVLDIYPVSRSTWYAGVKAGRYPRGINLSAKSVAWWEDEVLALAHGQSRAKS